MKIKRKNNCCTSIKNAQVSNFNFTNSQERKRLVILWKRLVNNGKTCPRCLGTELELEKVVSYLDKTLNKNEIEIILKKEEISNVDFEKDPLISNQIIINEKPLEEWLNGKTGQSSCCDVCKDIDCRTIEIGDIVYEIVPYDLILKACLQVLSKFELSR